MQGKVGDKTRVNIDGFGMSGLYFGSQEAARLDLKRLLEPFRNFQLFMMLFDKSYESITPNPYFARTGTLIPNIYNVGILDPF